MNDTLKLQKELDPTTKAQAQVTVNYPVAIRKNDYMKSILIHSGKALEISDYGEDYETMDTKDFKRGNATQIPITDFISELEAIIAEVKSKHGLAPIEWSFPEPQNIATTHI